MAAQATLILRKQLDRTALAQSERQQLRMAETLQFYLGNYLSAANRSGADADAVYTEVLAWKGSVSARQRAMRENRNGQHNPNYCALFDRLIDTARELETVSRAVPPANEPAKYHARIEQLSNELESIEQKLSEVSAEFREQKAQQNRSPGNISQVLPADTVLVDWLEYWRFRPAEKGKPFDWQQQLAAFVVHSAKSPNDGDPKKPTVELIEVGASQPIAAAIDRWRQNFSSDDAAELRRLVWQPLEAKLGNAKTVLVSPDGPFNRFPLSALPGKQAGTYLIEDVAIATIPIPRLLPELLAAQQLPKLQPSLLLVGGVDFSVDPGRLAPMALDRGVPRGNDPKPWPALPGTVGEIDAIRQSFVAQGRREAADANRSRGHEKCRLSTTGRPSIHSLGDARFLRAAANSFSIERFKRRNSATRFRAS